MRRSHPKPPLVYATALLLGLAAGRVADPGFAPESWARLGLGLAAIAAGCAVVATCALAYRRHGEELSPEVATARLVTEGPFRYSRNPVYLGMTAVHVGIGIAADQLFVIASGAAAFIWIAARVVPGEERYLAAQLPAAYAAYREEVRRWL